MALQCCRLSFPLDSKEILLPLLNLSEKRSNKNKNKIVDENENTAGTRNSKSKSRDEVHQDNSKTSIGCNQQLHFRLDSAWWSDGICLSTALEEDP